MADTPRPARPGARARASRARGAPAPGILVPTSRPSFRLNPEARVFHIGCRFARALESAMARAGVRVTSLGRDDDIEEIRTNPSKGHLCFPGPDQIRQELDWASGARAYREEGLLPLADGWVDPCVGLGAPGGNLAMIRQRRAALTAYFSRALEADLVVVTLSETETWYDRRSKQALQGAPTMRFYRADPDRFGARRLGHDDVVPMLRRIVRTVRGGNESAKIVFAVSPFPIGQTWSGEDLLTANMTAKSTLHSAVATVTAGLEGVDHFPAYEAVQHSDPGLALTADRKRLRPAMLDALTAALMQRYGLYLSAETRTLGSA